MRRQACAHAPFKNRCYLHLVKLWLRLDYDVSVLNYIYYKRIFCCRQVMRRPRSSLTCIRESNDVNLLWRQNEVMSVYISVCVCVLSVRLGTSI